MDIISIKNTISYGFIEVTHLLITHLTDDVEHNALVLFYLTITELTLKHLLGKETILYLGLLQRQTDFRFCSRRLNDSEPFLTWFLIGRSENLYLVATL